MKTCKLDDDFKQAIVDHLSTLIRILSQSSPREGEEGDLQLLIADRMAQNSSRVRSFDAPQAPGFFTHPLCRGPEQDDENRSSTAKVRC